MWHLLYTYSITIGAYVERNWRKLCDLSLSFMFNSVTYHGSKGITLLSIKHTLWTVFTCLCVCVYFVFTSWFLCLTILRLFSHNKFMLLFTSQIKLYGLFLDRFNFGKREFLFVFDGNPWTFDRHTVRPLHTYTITTQKTETFMRASRSIRTHVPSFRAVVMESLENISLVLNDKLFWGRTSTAACISWCIQVLQFMIYFRNI